MTNSVRAWFPRSGMSWRRFSRLLLAVSLPASVALGKTAMGVGLVLAVLAVLIAAARGWRPRHGLVPGRAMALSSVAVAVAWIPSIVGSLHPVGSVQTVLGCLGMVMMAWLAAVAMDEADDGLPSRWFLVVLAVALVFSLLALLVWPPLFSFRSRGLPAPALMLKAAASALVCAVPVVVLLAWRLGAGWRIVAGFCVAASLAVMDLTASKSSLAALLVAGIAVGIAVSTRPLRSCLGRGMAWLAALAAGIAAIGGLIHRFTPHEILGGYALFAPPWMVDRHRQTIWQFAMDRFAEHPWRGWGISMINQVPGAGDIIPELGYEFVPSHTHDWIVQILSEAGVIGFCALAAVVAGVGLAALRWWYRSGRGEALAWLALWVGYWTANLFNFSLWNTWWQSCLVVLAAMIVHVRALREAERG